MAKTGTVKFEGKNFSDNDEISNFFIDESDLKFLDSTPLYLELSQFSDNKLFFEGSIKTKFKEDITLNVVNTTSCNIIECENIENNEVNEFVDSDYVTSFHVEVPVTSDFFNFYFSIEVNNRHYTFNPKIIFNNRSLLTDKFNIITKDDHILIFKDNQFKIYERNYLLSIIIAVQDPINLRRQLDSIYNNFSENFQIILVNYGKNPGTKLVAEEYKKLFSENFVYIKEDEHNLNNAILSGLGYSNGTYVSIFDFNDENNPFDIKLVNNYIVSNNDYFYYAHENENEDFTNICNLFVRKEYLMNVLKDDLSITIMDFLEDKINEKADLNKELIELSYKISEGIHETDYENIPSFVEENIVENTEYVLNNINFNSLTDKEKDDLLNNLTEIYSHLSSDSFNKFSKGNLTLLKYLVNEKHVLNTSEEYSVLLRDYDSVYDVIKPSLDITYMYVEYDNLYIRGIVSHELVNDVQVNIIREKNEDRDVIYTALTKHVSGIPKDNYSNFEVTVPLTRFEEFKLYFEVIAGKSIFKPRINYSNNIKSFISDYYFISKEDYCLSISRGYNFSIVMAIYNTEYYLEQTLDSVISQSISFEDNVQLILIDDGSQDKSKDICLRYQEKYPENIVFLEQKNSGQATARNNGSKYIKGRYVNFLDSDDYLSENTLENVYKFFRTCDDEVDLIAIPIKFFGRKENYHMLHNKFKKQGIIDLIKQPNNPQLSSSSAFINSYLFDEYTFPTNIISSEDTVLLNKILLRTKKYGIVTDAVYYYRKRFDESSTIDSVSQRKEFFTDKLKYYFLELINYSLHVENEVLDFIKYLIAYDIQWMLKEPSLDILDSDEKEEFYRYLDEILRFIDEECILKNEYVTNNIFKSYFMSLKNRDKHFEIEPGNVSIKTSNYKIDQLKTHNIWMDIVEIKDDTLYLSGFINSNFKIDELSINAERNVGENTEVFTGEYVRYTSREDITFLSDKWQYKHSFDIKIPLTKSEETFVNILTVFHEENSEDCDVSCYLTIKLGKHVKLSSISNYLVKDDYILIFENNTFKIYRYSYKLMKKFERNVHNRILRKKVHNYQEAIQLRKKYLRYYPLIRLFKRFFQIHIYMDRLDVADDNSEHLFRYANRQRDNVRKYYVISENSPDFNRLSKYGKVIPYKSAKNKFLYLLADKVISTHPYESGINPFFSYNRRTDERENYSGLINSQIYFLQHGVTKDDISDWMSKYDKNLSLLVTVSDKEKESFYVEGYGYDRNIIQTLGFPRYDNLRNNSNKQILIIPTWRKYLRGNKNLFVNSDYFNNLNNLLNNKEFISYAKEKGYKIVFKAHPELEKPINDTDELYIDLFDIDDYVKLSTKESYQDLFNNSSLLITDYSSVFFDFAYQKKPVVYYHPSDDYHYQEGYFSYDNMGFGEIIEDEDSMVSIIKEYMDNDCKMKEEYVKRVDTFFKYTDKNNSKRVYDWIKKH